MGFEYPIPTMTGALDLRQGERDTSDGKGGLVHSLWRAGGAPE
jgi:hypothetical protein